MKVVWLFFLVLTLEVGLSLPQASAERTTAGSSVAAPAEEAAAAGGFDCCAECSGFAATNVCPVYCGATTALAVERHRAFAARLRIPATASGVGRRGIANPPEPAPPRYASPA